MVVANMPYLGHIVCSDLSDSTDIDDKTNKFYGQVYGFLSTFSVLRCDRRARLFDSYCSSFYGCELWDTVSGNSDHAAVAWRKAVRHLRYLPNITLCNILSCLMNELAAADVFRLRAYKFVCSNLVCGDSNIRHLSE